MPPQVAIGELVSPVETWNPSRLPSGTFDYIELAAVDHDTKVIAAPRKLVGAQAPSRARQLVASGDVLVSTVRPNLNGVAKVPPELDGAVASTGFCVLRPRLDMLDSNYLFHWVKSSRFVAHLTQCATGASYPAVTDRLVLETRLPAPPLCEQRRIAAILNQADTLRTSRRAAVAMLDDLIQSIFLEMFGDPARNLKSWPIQAFGEIAEIKLGKMLDVKRQTGANRRPYLRNANVQWNRFDLSDLFQMDFDNRERSLLALRPGDLLVCEGGEPGRCAVWEGQLRDCFYQKALHRCRFNLDVAEPKYFAHLLRLLATRGLLLRTVTFATIAHLTAEKLRMLPVPVPPKLLQRQFRRRLDVIDHMAQRMNRSSRTLESLFSSLQHRAFRGEL